MGCLGTVGLAVGEPTALCDFMDASRRLGACERFAGGRLARL